MKSYLRDLPTALLLLTAVLFFSIDLTEQFTAREYPLEWHHILEWFVFCGVLYFCWREFHKNKDLRELMADQSQRLGKASGDLSRYIEQCFSQWGLTTAESEVAWLLIKGFSFTEIAALREVREKTVRQQAASIYKKSELKGRAELVAYFLEDLIAASPGNTDKLI